jgi:hypothetical protein
MLERGQNERDVLDALGKYECDAGMSVEDVSAIVHVKTLKGRLIAHKFNTGWTVGVKKSVQRKKSVAGQFPVKHSSETLLDTKTEQERLRRRNKLGTSCCCNSVNTAEKQ